MKRIGLLVAALLQACGTEGWRYVNASDEQATVLNCALSIAAEEGSATGGVIEVRHWDRVIGFVEPREGGWIVGAQDDGSIAIAAQVLAQKLVDSEARPLVLRRVSEECFPP